MELMIISNYSWIFQVTWYHIYVDIFGMGSYLAYQQIALLLRCFGFKILF